LNPLGLRETTMSPAPSPTVARSTPLMGSNSLATAAYQVAQRQGTSPRRLKSHNVCLRYLNQASLLHHLTPAMEEVSRAFTLMLLLLAAMCIARAAFILRNITRCQPIRRSLVSQITSRKRLRLILLHPRPQRLLLRTLKDTEDIADTPTAGGLEVATP
jgi:hypothetical protein